VTELAANDYEEAQGRLTALSEWIDAGNAHRDEEAVLWGRVAKLTEECGEAMAALIGFTGQNPRKGFTHSRDDVTEELLDVAVTALGAIEHVRGHDGRALAELVDKINRVHARAIGAAR
jgi:NTP pyrophosphatase (non-canonical NTP hydrolase)